MAATIKKYMICNRKKIYITGDIMKQEEKITTKMVLGWIINAVYIPIPLLVISIPPFFRYHQICNCGFIPASNHKGIIALIYVLSIIAFLFPILLNFLYSKFIIKEFSRLYISIATMISSLPIIFVLIVFILSQVL
jgi:hypothetical protein